MTPRITVGAIAALLTAAAAASPLGLSCLGCHQPKINSPSMPALNSRSPMAIAAYLRQVRDAPPPGSIMARFTSKLTDAEIDALALELGRAVKSR